METDFFSMELEKFRGLLCRRLENRPLSFYEIELILDSADCLRRLSLFLDTKNDFVLRGKK